MTDTQILLGRIEAALGALAYPATPEALYEPVAYTMAGGGKRLRPLLTLMAAEACGADSADVMQQALAMEMYHNFTLIHDDVMDRSDTRHGRPTVYARNGSTQAILSGDALLSMAMRQLATDCPAELIADAVELFSQVALGVYEGQQLDMDFEERDDVTVAEYMEMIRLKTSVLLGGACAMGALMARAPREVRDALYKYGENLGLAFQLRDDWLDTYGDPATFGKPIGGDIVNGKKTWLHLTACAEAPDRMAAATAIADPQARIDAVRDIYTSLGLPERSDTECRRYADLAVEALESAGLPADDTARLGDLARRLSTRAK